MIGGTAKRERRREESNFGWIKEWQITKREHKERAEDRELLAVTTTSVKGAVLQDMIRVQDLHIHISYPECKSRKFFRNVGSVSA
jgi:hypothetical protein